MLYPIDNLGQYGILRDGLPHELPVNAWSDGRNCRFREGYAEKFLGHVAAFGSSSITPYHVASLQVGATRWWLEAGLAKIYSINASGTHTDITRASGGDYAASADYGWTSTTLGGIAVLNNGVDVPQAWAGTGKCVDLSGWPSTLRARSVRAFRNFLVAVGISKSGASYPHTVKWSTPADPGSVPASWDETNPAYEAGEGPLSETTSELVDSYVLGNLLILYKEGAYYALEDVGGLEVFRSTLISPDAGALSTNCVASFPGGHCVLGQGDVYVHSGGAPETILTARARRWLFNNLDSTNYLRSFVVANPLASEIWVCIPGHGQAAPDRALVWNHKANTLGMRDLPPARHAATGTVDGTLADSWDVDVEPWYVTDDAWNQGPATKASTRLVLAGSGLMLADAGTSFAGSAMTAMLERTGLSLDAPERVKHLRGLRPIFEGSPGGQVTIELGAAMDAQGPVTWSAPIPFTIGTDLQADGFATGRFLAVRITSSSLLNWRLKKMALDVQVGGAY